MKLSKIHAETKPCLLVEFIKISLNQLRIISFESMHSHRSCMPVCYTGDTPRTKGRKEAIKLEYVIIFNSDGGRVRTYSRNYFFLLVVIKLLMLLYLL